jgi:hypothetical protein
MVDRDQPMQGRRIQNDKVWNRKKSIPQSAGTAQ